MYELPTEGLAVPGPKRVTVAPTADTSRTLLAGAGSGHALACSESSSCISSTASSAVSAAHAAPPQPLSWPASVLLRSAWLSSLSSATASRLTLRTAHRSLLLLLLILSVLCRPVAAPFSCWCPACPTTALSGTSSMVAAHRASAIDTGTHCTHLSGQWRSMAGQEQQPSAAPATAAPAPATHVPRCTARQPSDSGCCSCGLCPPTSHPAPAALLAVAHPQAMFLPLVCTCMKLDT